MTSGELTLAGRHICLEPLRRDHIEALVAASVADPSLAGEDIYRYTVVPQTLDATTRYVETALRWQDEGTSVPFAVLRLSDNTVIGSTRYWNIERWLWPSGHARHGNPHPDALEIGYTWYARSAIRTAANSESKFLMLQHAFEVWNVLRVCLHTDSRNTRSQAAMERIGFKREGVLHAHKLAADNIPRDSVRYSMLPAEWPEARLRLAARLKP